MVLMGYSGARGTLIYEKNLKSKISCQTPFKCTDVLLKTSFGMYKIVHNERCSFFANWKQYHVYPITVNLHKGSPPPPLTERKELRQ